MYRPRAERGNAVRGHVEDALREVAQHGAATVAKPARVPDLLRTGGYVESGGARGGPGVSPGSIMLEGTNDELAQAWIAQQASLAEDATGAASERSSFVAAAEKTSRGEAKRAWMAQEAASLAEDAKRAQARGASEEDARQARLSSLQPVSAEAAKMELRERCDAGEDAACEALTLSREQAAKLKWLGRLEKP